MIKNAEFGYTPNNLKLIRQAFGLTQQELADTLDVRRDSIGRWESELNNQNHQDMPHKKWQMLKKHLNINEKGMKMSVSIIDLGVPNRRRVVSGSLLGVLDLDYTKSLHELQAEIKLAIEALQQTQGLIKNMRMFFGKDILVYRGNNHIDIVNNGKGSLNWLFIGDSYIDINED